MAFADTPTYAQLKDTAMRENQYSLDMPGERQAPPESYLKTIMRIILQYPNLIMKDKGQGHSLKNESLPPATVMTQESVTREKLIYSLAAEVYSLINVLSQILVN